MKKVIYIGMILMLLLLSGCGKDTRMADLQQQYREISASQMSAEIVCHLPSDNRTFTVVCSYDREQGSTTGITAPEEVKGISAAVSDDSLQVIYDGMILPAGEMTDICPANCLPYLLRAVSEGYVTEYSSETLEGRQCLRAAFDTTADSGRKILCTVWFDAENYLPDYAEFSLDGNIVLTTRILSFEIG